MANFIFKHVKQLLNETKTDYSPGDAQDPGWKDDNWWEHPEVLDTTLAGSPKAPYLNNQIVKANRLKTSVFNVNPKLTPGHFF